jgi:hypothetical protein
VAIGAAQMINGVDAVPVLAAYLVSREPGLTDLRSVAPGFYRAAGRM